MKIDLSKAIEVLQACGYECEEIESLRQQLDWVRNIVSMHGYDGPFGDGCCPLAEWLNEREDLRQQVDNLTEANRIMCEDFAAENNKVYQLEQQLADQREAFAVIAETPVSGEQDDITMEAKDRIAKAIRAWEPK